MALIPTCLPLPNPYPNLRIVLPLPNPYPNPRIVLPLPNPYPNPRIVLPLPNPYPNPRIVLPLPNPYPNPRIVLPLPNLYPNPRIVLPLPNPYPNPRIELPLPNPYPNPRIVFTDPTTMGIQLQVASLCLNIKAQAFITIHTKQQHTFTNAQESTDLDMYSSSYEAPKTVVVSHTPPPSAAFDRLRLRHPPPPPAAVALSSPKTQQPRLLPSLLSLSQSVARQGAEYVGMTLPVPSLHGWVRPHMDPDKWRRRVVGSPLLVGESGTVDRSPPRRHVHQHHPTPLQSLPQRRTLEGRSHPPRDPLRDPPRGLLRVPLLQVLLPQVLLPQVPVGCRGQEGAGESGIQEETRVPPIPSFPASRVRRLAATIVQLPFSPLPLGWPLDSSPSPKSSVANEENEREMSDVVQVSGGTTSISRHACGKKQSTWGRLLWEERGRIIGCMQGRILSDGSHLGWFVTRCKFKDNFGCFGRSRTCMEQMDVHGHTFMGMEASIG
ncbi:hypothetical protein LXL04_016000 [Taraxacum kok-saghyz]